jgi:hypothetical protein
LPENESYGRYDGELAIEDGVVGAPLAIEPVLA